MFNYSITIYGFPSLSSPRRPRPLTRCRHKPNPGGLASSSRPAVAEVAVLARATAGAAAHAMVATLALAPAVVPRSPSLRLPRSPVPRLLDVL